jgi:hypothetical protein
MNGSSGCGKLVLLSSLEYIDVELPRPRRSKSIDFGART